MKKRNIIIHPAESAEFHWKSRPSEIRGYTRAYYLTADNGDYVRIDYNIRDKRVRLYVEVQEEGGSAYFSVISNGRITSEKSMASGRSFSFADRFQGRADVFSSIPNREVLRLIKKNYGIGAVNKQSEKDGPQSEKKQRLEETRKRYFKLEDNPYILSRGEYGYHKSELGFIDLVDFLIGVLISGIVLIIMNYNFMAAGISAAAFGLIIGAIDMIVRSRPPVFLKVLFFVFSGIALYIYGYYFF